VELVSEFLLPLLGEVGRAQYGHAGDLPAIEELPRNQGRLDSLADPDVIRDEDANNLLFEGHEQRHELVRAGLDRDQRERTERPGARTETKAYRIPQESRRAGVTELIRVGQVELRGGDGLEGHVHAGGFGVRAAERFEDQKVRFAPRLHDPLAAARPHQAADGKAHVLPSKCQRRP
jgi:hypothetical protein